MPTHIRREWIVYRISNRSVFLVGKEGMTGDFRLPRDLFPARLEKADILVFDVEVGEHEATWRIRCPSEREILTWKTPEGEVKHLAVSSHPDQGRERKQLPGGG